MSIVDYILQFKLTTLPADRKPSKPKQTSGTVETYLPVTGGEGDKVKDGDLCCCIPTASLWVKWD